MNGSPGSGREKGERWRAAKLINGEIGGISESKAISGI